MWLAIGVWGYLIVFWLLERWRAYEYERARRLGILPRKHRQDSFSR